MKIRKELSYVVLLLISVSLLSGTIVTADKEPNTEMSKNFLDNKKQDNKLEQESEDKQENKLEQESEDKQENKFEQESGDKQENKFEQESGDKQDNKSEQESENKQGNKLKQSFEKKNNSRTDKELKDKKNTLPLSNTHYNNLYSEIVQGYSDDWDITHGSPIIARGPADWWWAANHIFTRKMIDIYLKDSTDRFKLGYKKGDIVKVPLLMWGNLDFSSGKYGKQPNKS